MNARELKRFFTEMDLAQLTVQRQLAKQGDPNASIPDYPLREFNQADAIYARDE